MLTISISPHSQTIILFPLLLASPNPNGKKWRFLIINDFPLFYYKLLIILILILLTYKFYIKDEFISFIFYMSANSNSKNIILYKNEKVIQSLVFFFFISIIFCNFLYIESSNFIFYLNFLSDIF